MGAEIATGERGSRTRERVWEEGEEEKLGQR